MINHITLEGMPSGAPSYLEFIIRLGDGPGLMVKHQSMGMTSRWIIIDFLSYSEFFRFLNRGRMVSIFPFLLYILTILNCLVSLAN